MPPSADPVIEYPAKKAIVLKNRNCVYCGGHFDEDRPSTKEHVIGRRFVPLGCFDGQWNLIVNACEACNNEKADLEDDISVITMMPDHLGEFAIDDPRLASEVARKAHKSRSRRTGKAVAASEETIEVKQRFGPAEITFNFAAPAQASEQRLLRLAHMHFLGFFFMLTFKDDTRLGTFAPGKFIGLMSARRHDWGNPQMRWFMDLVRDWDLRLHAVGADGFFKMIIRRHPDGREVWAWALEWNHGLRFIGFHGDEADVQNLCNGIPPLQFTVLKDEPEHKMRVRVDIPLPEDEDNLFTQREGVDMAGAAP